MAQIDLIPASYYAYLRAKRVLRHAGIVAGTILCTTAIVFASIHFRLHNENKQLASLRPEAEQITALRTEITAMQERKNQLKMQEETLAMLRGKGEAELAVAALDRALNDNIWLIRLHFRRLNVSSETSSSDFGAAQNGLQQIEQNAAGTSGSNTADHSLALQSRIDMQGAAADHAMLAQFMDAIAHQPGIAKVRFLNSSANHAEASSEIQFSVDAVIRSPEKNGD